MQETAIKSVPQGTNKRGRSRKTWRECAADDIREMDIKDWRRESEDTERN